MIDELPILNKQNSEEICEQLILSEIITEFRSNNERPEYNFELLAFKIQENYAEKKTQWSENYGPQIIYYYQDGSYMESPSIKELNQEIFIYWEKRTFEAKHPILKARYSGLVWELKEKITNQKPDIKFANIFINSIIELVNEEYRIEKFLVFQKLRIALTLAIRINNNDLVMRVKEAIILYENNISEDNYPGLWGYCYELLITNKKVNLTKEEENNIIYTLETRLNNLIKKKSENAVTAIKYLTSYYNSKKNKDALNQVLNLYCSLIEEVNKNKSAWQSIYNLENLYTLLKQYNHENTDKILIEIKNLGERAKEELGFLRHEFTIPFELFELYINEFIDLPLNLFFEKVAITLIPKKSEIEDQINDLSKKHPLLYLFNTKIIDQKGRVAAEVGSWELDKEGIIIYKISENASLYNSILFSALISEYLKINKFNTIDISKFLSKSMSFEQNNLKIIELALNAYFKNDFIIFLHLIIPQIESSVRTLLELSGGTVLKQARTGGYHLKTFDEILRDEMICKCLGEDATLFFRAVFTDPRGLNLRNKISHGLAPLEVFNQANSHIVFRALLYLGLAQNKEEN